MNTKLIMTVTSVVLGVAGLACLFVPGELAGYVDPTGDRVLVVLIQIWGALYLGFAMANWMGKDLAIGGIYGRPLSMANFMHFFVGAIALLKAVPMGNFTWPSATALSVYVLFAVLFGYLVFFHRSGARP